MAIAKVELICRCCGETFTLRKERRNWEEAQSFIEWAKENVGECPECRAKRLKREELVKALEGIGELPELTGSPKQIAWASSIREDRILAFDKIVFKNQAACYKMLWKITLREKTSATWWIDNRNASISEFVNSLGRDADLMAKTKEAFGK